VATDVALAIGTDGEEFSDAPVPEVRQLSASRPSGIWTNLEGDDPPPPTRPARAASTTLLTTANPASMILAVYGRFRTREL
jgi:hypothetical protein